MYKVYIDDQLLYDPGSNTHALTAAKLNFETGFASCFEFTVPATNPMADKIKNLSSLVRVMRDKEEIFYGSVQSMTNFDFQKSRTFQALSAMSWLNDSVQPQDEFHDITVRQFLEKLVTEHNSRVEDQKKFTVGIVTIKDSNDSLYRYTNFESTLDCIRDKLVDRLGGVLRVRHENNKLYLDYLSIEEYGVHSTQKIEFGLNLLDYSESLTTDDIITVLIPRGAVIDQDESEKHEVLDKRVDITSVNHGLDYIVSPAIETFGAIWGVAEWDEVTLPSNLLTKAQEYLLEKQFENLTIELQAADLADLGVVFEHFREGDRITCLAPPFGMNAVLPIMALEIDLLNPASNSLTLSKSLQLTYTASNEKSRTIQKQELETVRRIQSDVLRSSIDNITAMMTGAKGGYKITEYDEQGRWLRDLYLDTPDPATAKRVLQINKDGIGGSVNGINGPYVMGILIDGTILGDRIVAGSIHTDQLTVECIADIVKKSDDYTDSEIARAEAKFSIDFDGLKSIVSTKTDKSTVQSLIKQSSDEIKLSVNNYTDEKVSQVSSQLTLDLNGLKSTVSQKTDKSTVESMISQKAEEILLQAESIRLKAKTLVWQSTYSSLTENGTLSAKNAIFQEATIQGGEFTCLQNNWTPTPSLVVRNASLSFI